jgi:DNA-binding HxlR family transcriptional regulator
VAAINLLEKPEVQDLLTVLIRGKHTASQLNQRIVIEKGLCSTASLYRRLSELQMASIIEKESEHFKITSFGENLYLEFKEKESLIVNRRKIKVLEVLKQDQWFSTSEILRRLSISPNDFIKIMKELEAEDLVELETRISGSPRGGRPQKLYRLSKRGRTSSDEYKKFRDKLTKE